MLFNEFISKSQKFLCLGLSVMTAASIMSANRAEASPVTNTFTVTNISDSGAGSLRQAILNANADSTKSRLNASNVEVINFNLGSGAHTITLTSAPLNLAAKHLTITGTGASLLTISGNTMRQVFTVAPFTNATVSSLTITDGSSKDYGGAIYNDGTLSLTDDTVSNSTAAYGGGGIYNDGTLTITNSVITQNTAGNGGGLLNVNGTSNATATINNGSSFTFNSAPNGYGGAIDNAATLNASNSHFNNNSSAYGGGALFNNGTATLGTDDFNNNTTGGKGGAIENSSVTGVVSITELTFSGDQAAGSANIPGDNADIFGTLTLIPPI